MAMSNDYIPQADRKFLVWVKNVFANVEKNAERWHLNPASFAHIVLLISSYETALIKSEHPNHGTVDTLEKNKIRNSLKKEVRGYVKEFLKYNSIITSKERKRMALPLHNTKPTPTKTPDSIPVTSTKQPLPGVVELHFVDSISGRKAKPKGVHGYDVKWVISDTAPKDWDELTNSEFFTRTPGRMTFSGKQRGNKLFLASRYENTRGVKGPWSEIIMTIIP
jgi:hypothetical protein